MTTRVVLLGLGVLSLSLLAGVLFSPYTPWELLTSPVLGLPEIREILRAQSPDGKVTVVAVSVNQGGATVGFKYEILLSKEGEESPIMSRQAIWRSYKVRPSQISWKSDRAVSVVVSTSDSSNFWRIRTTPNGPIVCTTVDEGGTPVAVSP